MQKSILKEKKIFSLESKAQRIKAPGEKYVKKLIEHFKTYSNIYNASLEELEKVLPKNLALKIYNKDFIGGLMCRLSVQNFYISTCLIHQQVIRADISQPQI